MATRAVVACAVLALCASVACAQYITNGVANTYSGLSGGSMSAPALYKDNLVVAVANSKGNQNYIVMLTMAGHYVRKYPLSLTSSVVSRPLVIGDQAIVLGSTGWVESLDLSAEWYPVWTRQISMSATSTGLNSWHLPDLNYELGVILGNVMTNGLSTVHSYTSGNTYFGMGFNPVTGIATLDRWYNAGTCPVSCLSGPNGDTLAVYNPTGNIEDAIVYGTNTYNGGGGNQLTAADFKFFNRKWTTPSRGANPGEMSGPVVVPVRGTDQTLVFSSIATGSYCQLDALNPVTGAIVYSKRVPWTIMPQTSATAVAATPLYVPVPDGFFGSDVIISYDFTGVVAGYEVQSGRFLWSYRLNHQFSASGNTAFLPPPAYQVTGNTTTSEVTLHLYFGVSTTNNNVWAEHLKIGSPFDPSTSFSREADSALVAGTSAHGVIANELQQNNTVLTITVTGGTNIVSSSSKMYFMHLYSTPSHHLPGGIVAVIVIACLVTACLVFACVWRRCQKPRFQPNVDTQYQQVGAGVPKPAPNAGYSQQPAAPAYAGYQQAAAPQYQQPQQQQQQQYQQQYYQQPAAVAVPVSQEPPY